jgi:hypothetical protein
VAGRFLEGRGAAGVPGGGDVRWRACIQSSAQTAIRPNRSDPARKFNNAELSEKGYSSLTGEETTSRLRLALIAIALIGGSLLLRCYYVFHFTDYTNYVTTDMGGYWDRAEERYAGDVFNQNQWVLWPPLFHIILTDTFYLYHFFGVNQHLVSTAWLDQANLTHNTYLQLTLFWGCLAGSISVYVLFLLSNQILKNERLALAVAIVYGLSYHIIYLNCMVLAENLSIPLVITGTYLVVRYPDRLGYLLLAGLLFGVASGIRPASLPQATFCIIYLLITQPDLRRKARAGAAFAAAIGVVLFAVWHEDARISRGLVPGLSANGGLNFFIAQRQMIEVVTKFPMGVGAYLYGIGADQFGDDPLHHGHFRTTVPFYAQAYWTRMGLLALAHPSTWIADFKELRKVFFETDLFPRWYSAEGFKGFDPFFMWLCGIATLAALIVSPVLWYLRRRDGIPWAVVLLWSYIIGMLIQCYFFGCERRYLYPTLFCTYLILGSWLPQLLQSYATSVVEKQVQRAEERDRVR